MAMNKNELAIELIVNDKVFNRQFNNILKNSQKLMSKATGNMVKIFEKNFQKMNKIAKANLKITEVSTFVKSCQDLEKSLARSERIVSTLFPQMNRNMSIGIINTGKLADNTVKKVKKAFAKVDTINKLSFGSAEETTPPDFKPGGDIKGPSIQFSPSIEQAKQFQLTLAAIRQEVLNLPTSVDIQLNSNIGDLFNQFGDIHLDANLNIDGIMTSFDQLLKLIPTFATEFSQSLQSNLEGSIHLDLGDIKNDIIGQLDLSNNVGEISTNITTTINSAIDTIPEEQFTNTGEKVTGGLISGIMGNINSFFTAGENILTTLLGPFDSGKDMLLEKLEAILEPVQGFIDGFAPLIANFDSFKEMFNNFKDAISGVQGAFDTIKNSETIQAFGNQLLNLYTSITTNGLIPTLQSLSTTLINGLTPAFNVVFSSVGLTLLAIMGLAAGFLYLYTTSESFRELMNGMFDAIAEHIQVAISNIIMIIETIWSVGIQPMIESVMLGFEYLWNNGLAVLIENVSVFVLQIIELVLSIWNNAVAPFIDLLLNIFLPNFTTVWDALLAIAIPIIDKIVGYLNGFMEAANIVIGVLAEHFLPIFKTVFDGIRGAVQWFWDIARPIFDMFMSVLGVLVSFLVDKFFAKFDVVFTAVVSVIKGIASPISEALDGVKGILQGIIDFVSGVFSGDWEQAWQGIVGIFEGVVGTISGIFKIPVNAVISLINGAISNVNGFGFDIPDWVPFLGGQSFRVNIPAIPLLAQGGYIKANQPQLAVVGDNRHQGEIIAPEDKMVDMINTALKMQQSRQSLDGLDQLISLIEELIQAVKNLHLKVNIDSKKLSVLLDNAKRERQMIGG
ncbi:phage tail protein [Beduini massiliensis]|uniref:phage tail protein n=1 Tax=Beduini massiliensis TaxID=1585974 RepID=UPI000694DA99|nr:hypothetical protein [Beduini massiliensis]